jgi:exosortase
MGYPLQRIATLASTYALQTMGLPAVAEGNVILIDEARIGVVEACNGLGMLFMFFAFATAATFVIRRPAADKAVILLSAIPIALAANVARITLTGLLHVTAGGEVADVVYHDLAGWLMMPLALATLWAESGLLSRLLIEPAPAGALPMGAIYGAGVVPAAGGPAGRRLG